VINPTEPKVYLPLIRSLYSPAYVEPEKWIAEIENDGSYSILTAIENYEFIIACLIKAISVMEIPTIGIDKSLMSRVNNIFDKHDEYLRKYFNLKEEERHYKKLYSIIRFIVFKDHFGNKENDIKYFCAAWNSYFKYIFDSSEYYPEDDDDCDDDDCDDEVDGDDEVDEYKNNEDLSYQKFAALKNKYKCIINTTEFEKYFKFRIFDYNYDLLTNLFDFFCGKKNSITNSFVDKKIVEVKRDKNYYITEKGYSDFQKDLIYFKEPYFHIMEALQENELKAKLNLEDPIITRKDDLFFLTKPRSFFCDIVVVYYAEYNKLFHPGKEISDIDWSKFNKCVIDASGNKFNLKKNKNTSKRNSKYDEDINTIVDHIFEYIKKPENASFINLPKQKILRKPLIAKNL